MKSMSIRKEDRFDSAVIMNQVLRTAVVRTQERTKDGAEVPIQLKKLPRNAAQKLAPVPEPAVAKAPVTKAAPVESKPEPPVVEIANQTPAEEPKKEAAVPSFVART